MQTAQRTSKEPTNGSWDQKRSKMMGSLWLKFTDETLRGLEGAWKGLGRGLEGAWKGLGRGLEGAWKGLGRGLEGAWKGLESDSE